MYVGDIYAANRALGRPTISFEFFPPKTAEGEETLFAIGSTTKAFTSLLCAMLVDEGKLG